MSNESPSAVARLDDLRERQLLAWERGERLLVEALIDGTPLPLAGNALLEMIYAEVMLRSEREEVCLVDEYVQRFPQFAESLRRLFAIHEALGSPGGESSDVVKPPLVKGPQIKSESRSSDRNLLFGIVALQMDFISRDALIEALRDWTTQKDKPLGQILVERGDLPASRRELLEPLVDEHVRQHEGDPVASLASISSVIEGTVDWYRVHDVDIAESLAVRRLTRNAKPASLTGAGTSASNKGRFRVLRPHAEGGLGIVCVAQDEELHREVALKEIKPQFAKDDASRSRFTLEAEITGGLEHPGIVPVYGLGQYSDGRPYYAMRFIRGDSLKGAIERFHAGRRTAAEPPPTDVHAATVIGQAPPAPVMANVDATSHPASRQQFESVEFRKLLGRFIDVCQAIEYAHSRGVLHRDLKPGNIMLGKYGETLVVDWGLAKAAGKEERFANIEEATLVPSSGSSIEQTADGSVIGTPAYMSPEQAAGRLEQLGPATDVYSLGATLYHVLTGRSSFAKLPLPELLKRVQSGQFPRPRQINTNIPKALEAICLKAMSLNPGDRFESATAIAEDLEHWLANEPVSAHREAVWSSIARWRRRNPGAFYASCLAIWLGFTQLVCDWETRRLINGANDLRQSVSNFMKQQDELKKRQVQLAFAADAGFRSDWDAAVKLLQQIEINKENVAERRIWARALFYHGDYQQAARILLNGYGSQPHGHWENALLAAALAKSGQHSEALKCIELLRERSPDMANATIDLGDEAARFREIALEAISAM